MVSREKVLRSVTSIQEKTADAQHISIGLILGSGLGDALAGFDIRFRLPYSEIDGFPRSTVSGHAGELLLGQFAGCEIAVMSGRVHLYEGFSAAQACMPVRVLGELGIKTIILTNAAGSLNHAFLAGSLMLVDDHINFTGQSPLTGPNEDAWGPRFPDASRIYSPRLRDQAARTARNMGYDLHRGVYLQVAGPQYETPAEVRALRMLGADAVGMSTAIEALAASHMGMEVMALSCLTNQSIALTMGKTSHADVLEAAGRTAGDINRFLTELLPEI